EIRGEDAEMGDVWSQLAVFATRIDRYDQAVDAYKHYIALKPNDPAPYIGAAAALLKLRRLDEARAHAQLAVDVAKETDRRSRASAHEMLAEIALARHDTEAAREEAGLARGADPKVPLPIFIDARLLYGQGKYEEAVPLFEQAIAELKKSTLQITELHFYAADTLARLERYEEAEWEFTEELKYFPQNTRARAGPAMVYQATDQPDEAARVVADMTRITPTPDSYALAAKLYQMFGDRKKADAIRAESRGWPGAKAR